MANRVKRAMNAIQGPLSRYLSIFPLVTCPLLSSSIPVTLVLVRLRWAMRLAPDI
jgi:hypothetical protein